MKYIIYVIINTVTCVSVGNYVLDSILNGNRNIVLNGAYVTIVVAVSYVDGLSLNVTLEPIRTPGSR